MNEQIEQMQTSEETMTSFVDVFMHKILDFLNVSGGWAAIIKFIVLLTFVVLISYCLQIVFKKIFTFIFKKAEKTIPFAFFRYTLKNKLPRLIALLAPYTFMRNSIPYVFSDYVSIISPAIKCVDIFLVFMLIWIIMAVVSSFTDGLQERPALKDKPMKSYLQVVQIILFIIGAVVIFSILTGRSVTTFFAVMGGASAIMMLVFQDSIKGFVGSIQLTFNHMVKLGDWITMNKYGADGDVEDISLTTVKIRNFDKTITTIPTYSLISDSFQNWRGMQESGGRRIKKSIYIQHNSIRFLTDEELAKYKKVSLIKDFIEKKEKEFAELNKGTNGSIGLGIHRLTNNQLFIAYANAYLANHPHIHKGLTLLVRQMNPTPTGIEVEIYVFTDTVAWVEYEQISVEVLNHIIGVVKFFDLKIFEYSSVNDTITVNK